MELGEIIEDRVRLYTLSKEETEYIKRAVATIKREERMLEEQFNNRQERAYEDELDDYLNR